MHFSIHSFHLLIFLALLNMPLSLADGGSQKRWPEDLEALAKPRGARPGTLNVLGKDDVIEYDPTKPGYYYWSGPDEGAYKFEGSKHLCRRVLIVKSYSNRQDAAAAYTDKEPSSSTKYLLNQHTFAYLAYWGPGHGTPWDTVKDPTSKFTMVLSDRPMVIYDKTKGKYYTSPMKGKL
jgi:hypothetical protein